MFAGIELLVDASMFYFFEVSENKNNYSPIATDTVLKKDNLTGDIYFFS